MKKNYKLIKAGMIASSFLFCNVLSAQFTQGNIVVLQVGDGTPTYPTSSSSTAPVFLKEFSPVGVSGFSVVVPTGTAGLTITGDVSNNEGLITRSTDGHSILIAGYNVAAGTGGATTSQASVAPRGIGAVNPGGVFSLAVTIDAFYSADSFRSATSNGNGNFWGAGGGAATAAGVTSFSYNGVNTTTSGTMITPTTGVPTNERAIGIYNGQLYFSSGSGTKGVFSVGTGTPTTPTTATVVINTGGSPYQFAFNPTGTTCYIADKNFSIQKWIYNASSWSNAYTYSATAIGDTKAVGLVADFGGADPVIYATTANGASLIAITDGGSVASSTVTILAAAPVNTTFRGVAFSPTCITTSITSASGSGCTGSPLGLNVTALGTSPLSYTWTGAGTISNASIASPIVTNFSGNYTVTVKNACGTTASTVVIPTNGSPILSPISGITTCTGSSIVFTPTLTPNGANTSYTLITPSGATSLTTALAAMAVAPAGTYPCTLTAKDAVGCISNSQAFTITLDNCTGIIKYNELATSIAPNPAKESVEISFTISANRNISIINTLGQTVLTKNTDDMNVKIDISSFPQGIYFVTIVSGNQKAIKKLIVQ